MALPVEKQPQVVEDAPVALNRGGMSTRGARRKVPRKDLIYRNLRHAEQSAPYL
ncbi:hypothetical protein GCM10009784_02870 [Arthrobacter parietis]|uniref:Uncharacterized protein n=1 Tax=Arthrobacter parietis TaxID=271434 RepID=A0ABP5MEV4_9MICC